MPPQPSDLEVLKNNLVTHLFVDAADQDYILARMAYHKGLYTGFFWGAGQAIEKYLKATLLLNGRSSRDYNHNLPKLYENVCEFAADLLPEKLTQPRQFGKIHWSEETPVEFLKRIEQYVSPHNRYNIFGYSSRIEDLCHLDQLIFSLRRISFALHVWPFLGRQKEGPPQSVREMLERFPDYSPRGTSSHFSKLTGEKADPELRHAAFKLNFPFAPADYDHDRDGLRIGFSMAQSVLYTRILAPAENQSRSPGHTDAADLADWAIENIKLPSDVIDELKAAAKTLRQPPPMGTA